MENLPLEQAEVEADLGRIPGLKATALKPYLKSLGNNFFKIRYAPGEVIMPRGVQSDFAGLLKQGRVLVHDHQAPPSHQRAKPEECWNRPGLLLLHLERWTLDRTDRLVAPEDGPISRRDRAERSVARTLRAGLKRLEDWADRQDDRGNWWARGRGAVARHLFGWARRGPHERSLANPPSIEAGGGNEGGTVIAEITARDEQGNERDVMARFMGLSGALWNVPRSVTLVAQADEAGRPCELLLVKRKVLLEIEEQSEVFRRQTTDHFLDDELAPLLVENRLFRNTFAEEDINDWPAFLASLRGEGAARRPEAVRRIRQRLLAGSADFGRWTERPPDQGSTAADEEMRTLQQNQYRIVGALNTLLKRDDLDSASAWPDPGVEAKTLRDQPVRSESETIRLNHLLVAQAFEGLLRTGASPGTEGWPLRAEQFQELIHAMRTIEGGGGITLRHFSKDEAIYEQGDPSTDLFLIVSGTVRVTRREPGGEVLLNQLERHGYFGVSCIEDDAVHSATIRAVTEVNAVALGRGAVRLRMDRLPALGRKLRGERARLRRRDAMMTTLDRLPPVEPPEEVASKLMVAGNLLRIDMDRCTRCDQCVRACAESHDGIPRFARSNPSLRFGRWEVAAACVHCRDAPCQKACPVGAIAFLDDGTVQVHRARCIGCEQCVPACPFDVIDMALPPTRQDIADKNKSGLVATKCDLCLNDRRDPPCVSSCPYGAAERGTPRELFPEIKSWADVQSPR